MRGTKEGTIRGSYNRWCNCGKCHNCITWRSYWKHREEILARKKARRKEKKLEKLEKPKFKLAVRYEWDRTTKEDYGMDTRI